MRTSDMSSTTFFDLKLPNSFSLFFFRTGQQPSNDPEAAIARDTTQHGDGKKTDFLVLGDFAEIRDANSEISKGAMPDNGREVLLVQTGDDFERRADDPF